MSEQNNSFVWMVIELMGHVTLAGKVSKPSEWGGLWQVDIPEGESYRTEFVSIASIYKARPVSEDIARAYAQRESRIIAYDVPIVTRDMHEQAMDRAREEIERLRRHLRSLEDRLIAVDDHHQLNSGDREEPEEKVDRFEDYEED